jgi:hypothetical protein
MAQNARQYQTHLVETIEGAGVTGERQGILSPPGVGPWGFHSPSRHQMKSMVLRIKASSDAFFYAQTMPKLNFCFELRRRIEDAEVCDGEHPFPKAPRL